MRRTMWMVAACGLFACGGEGFDDGLATATVTETLRAPAPSSIAFARAMKERAAGVRIHDKPHHGGEVIYSLRLVDLTPEEQLRLRAEVTLSRCNEKDIYGQSGDGHTACTTKELQKSPYGYQPRFSARLVLGDSPHDTGGKPLSKWFDMSCHDDTHHCSLTIPEVAEQKLPHTKEKFLNLVVTADAGGHQARPWDVMEVEEHHGGLYATRLAPGAKLSALHEQTHKLRAQGKLVLDEPKEDGDKHIQQHLVYQLRLQGLKPGDVVDVDARMRAVMHVHGVECAPLVTGEVLLAENPHARKANGKHDAHITVKNGRNCKSDTKKGCLYRESGAVQLKKGTPATMYVSYIARSLKSCVIKGDKWHIDPSDGVLDANVRR